MIVNFNCFFIPLVPQTFEVKYYKDLLNLYPSDFNNVDFVLTGKSLNAAGRKSIDLYKNIFEKATLNAM
jgi:hypothetical protein